MDGYFYQPSVVAGTQNIDICAFVKEYCNSADYLLTTRENYMEIYAECAEWPFSKPLYVITDVDLSFTGITPVEFITSDHLEYIGELKKNKAGCMGIMPTNTSNELMRLSRCS